ncbi:Hypothetical protein FORC64_p144 (plasmid) [Escherichia coli]|uniref:Uncharacterized protein n=3 Tax=Enterobacteriaceae TaxID=543 RepID=A0A2S1PLQ4_ECOLX|nr:hypothetical protein pPUTH2_0034 [Klebsiella pneumoniae]AWH59344.1 hypothetical protein [Escherichia coli]AXI37973.1 Hypothetical protein FORC64_p144 [Escherichia coli]QIS34459.1 hypothetical protein [Leclercia adecarboxylata]
MASKHKAAIYKALLQKCGGDRGTTPEPQIFPSVQIIHG